MLDCDVMKHSDTERTGTKQKKTNKNGQLLKYIDMSLQLHILTYLANVTKVFAFYISTEWKHQNQAGESMKTEV